MYDFLDNIGMHGMCMCVFGFIDVSGMDFFRFENGF